MPTTAPELIQVVAAALIDGSGRVLLAQRRLEAHQGGLWEFPGGKVEAGESLAAALSRELQEEIGVRPLQARPLKTVRHRYADRHIELAVWRVDAWSGQVHGCEGQALRWVALDELEDWPMPAADRPICTALCLPVEWAIVEDPDPPQLQRLSPQVAVLLRAPQLDPQDYAQRLQALRQAWPQRAWYAHDRVDLVQPLQLAGVHASTALWRRWTQRPLPWPWHCGGSAHDREDLQALQALGLDYAFLSPVQATASHPERPALGWAALGRLIEGLPLSVYALGGVGPQSLSQAFAQGAQGIAAIRAYL